MAIQDIEDLLLRGSIASIAHALRARDLSVREMIQFHLARIAAYNDEGARLNAIRAVAQNALEEAARADRTLESGAPTGPLHGIPVLVKDNFLIANDFAATAGAAALANFIPTRSATLVQRLRAAGAIIIGKTNLTELADYVAETMPAEFSGAGGAVRNPHGTRYGRGQGSSVGSAAAVAAGFAPVALGSETQNSIQTPASCSSVVGFKPSVGALSRAGIVPLVPSQDAPGTLTRSVEDAELVASVLAGADALDTLSLAFNRDDRVSVGVDTLQQVSIGVPRQAMADRPEFAAVLPLFEEILRRLAAHGATIVDPCDLPSAAQLQDTRSCVFRHEFKAALNAFFDEHQGPCGIDSLETLIRWNEAHPDKIPYGQSLLLAACETDGLDNARYRADRRRDVELSRTAGIDAALRAGNADVLIVPMGAAAKCTGKAGAPVIAIPAGLGTDGTPFGVTLFTSLGRDRILTAVARLVERTVGDRRAPSL